MTFMFNEGLPGSGKSYDCVSRHIAKALREGRPVDAYVEGLDHDKIAAVLELPPERVRELLRYVAEEDVMKLPALARDNGLVVIDELQNFFPTGRQKLSPEWTKFITEHRHRGLDILGMGQVLTDVHKLWRGRCKFKAVFNKLDAVGMEHRYNVQLWTATAPERYTKTSDTIEKYDPRWFGSYASVKNDAIQTSNYKDSRASIWNTQLFRFGLPVAGLGALWGVWQLYQFFSGGAVKPVAKPAAAASAPAPAVAPAKPQTPAPVRQVVTKAPLPFVMELNQKYRPRLAGYYTYGTGQDGVIEWWDDDKLIERLTFAQIRRLGSAVAVDVGVAVVADKYVTHWPLPEEQPKKVAVSVPGSGS